MWPSRVDRFGVVDPRPGEPQRVQKTLRSTITFVWGGAQEPQSGFPDGAEGRRRWGRAGGVFQVQFLEVVDILVVTQRLIPMVQRVQQTIEIPPDALRQGSRCRCCVVVRVPQVQVVMETVLIPQLQPVEKVVTITKSLGSSWTRSLTCPLVFNDRCWGSECKKTVGFQQFAAL